MPAKTKSEALRANDDGPRLRQQSFVKESKHSPDNPRIGATVPSWRSESGVVGRFHGAVRGNTHRFLQTTLDMEQRPHSGARNQGLSGGFAVQSGRTHIEDDTKPLRFCIIRVSRRAMRASASPRGRRRWWSSQTPTCRKAARTRAHPSNHSHRASTWPRAGTANTAE